MIILSSFLGNFMHVETMLSILLNRNVLISQVSLFKEGFCCTIVSQERAHGQQNGVD